MRILWTFCVYNEIELLPFKIDYIKKNDIDCYVFDNMSTDGSWEWLQENKIPSERFDSDNAFDLRMNTSLMARKIHEIKPDWAMFGGCDIFYVNQDRKTLRQVIEEADSNSFNLINSGYRALTFYYTGTEEPGIDPRLNYMYYTPRSIVHERCIGKFCNNLVIIADHFKLPNRRIMRDANFIFLHYHMRADAKVRKIEQYHRRKKAWDLGLLPEKWGHHYKKYSEMKNFVFDPNSLSNIRSVKKVWRAIKKSVING